MLATESVVLSGLWPQRAGGKLGAVRVAAFRRPSRRPRGPMFPVGRGEGRLFDGAVNHPQYAKARLTCIFVNKHGYCSFRAVVSYL